MKCKNLRLGTIFGAVLVAAALACGSLEAAAEGLNATYAGLANELAGSIQKAAGRNFSSQIKIQGITRDEMAAVLADEMALAKAERLGASDMQRRGLALSQMVPVRYSLSRGRIFFVQEVLRSRFESERLDAAAEQEAIRLLLAYELARVLMDQHCDLKARLAEAGTPARSKALRAGVEGYAHLIIEKLAVRRSRLALVPLAAGWPIGKGASSKADRDIAAALDEEFDLCWTGGYRFTAYLADKHGMDAVYRSCWAPPAELSLLYNPAGYKPETGPAPSARPGASTGGSASGVSKPSQAGRLSPALLAAKGHLPGGSWFDQVMTIEDLLKSNPGQADLFQASVKEWGGYRFVNLELGAMATAFGFRAGQEITEQDAQLLLAELQMGFAQAGQQDGKTYSPGNNIPLAGIGYGSGWFQAGTLSSEGDNDVPCWFMVARTDDCIICMSGINFTITTGQVTAMVNTVFQKLQ